MSVCEARALVYIAEAYSADLSFEADGGANLVVVQSVTSQLPSHGHSPSWNRSALATRLFVSLISIFLV